jgi:MoaA/NifB/PqqE/SkfB family radical SAM enzyme
MRKNPTFRIEIDDHGHMILPSDLLQRYALKPGDQITLRDTPNGVILRRPLTSLAKIYIEVTNSCNLGCSTCMRNVWDEPIGFMSEDTFSRFLQSLEACSPLPTVFFGGFGEPLSHPSIFKMISAVKKTGAEVELITNGTLLTSEILKGFIDLRLDRLWVSIDGATSESYADVRLGNELPTILSNLAKLQELRSLAYITRPKLGIAFVAMKRNIADLPAVLRKGRMLGADRFSITNVLAHTPELRHEILYERTLNDSELQSSPAFPLLSLPWMDIDRVTENSLLSILKNGYRLIIGSQDLMRGVIYCPFVEKGSTSIRWDGSVSPCLPLLHTHVSYLDDRLRETKHFAVGNILQRDLKEIWLNQPYLVLRERLQRFDFSPCSFCNSCELADNNEEDCFGNVLPTCGGCLWAQGLIQCP